MMKKGCRIITSDRSKNDLQGMSQMGNDPDADQDQSATGIGTWLGNMVSFHICKSQNLIDMYVIWLYLVCSNVSPAILGCQSRMSYIICGGLQPATRDAHDGRRDKILSNIKILSKISNSSIVLGTGFPCMMNFIAYKHYQKRRIGCPSSQNWKGNITRKQHILRTETNHNKSYFPWHVSLQSNDRWNPACWFNKPISHVKSPSSVKSPKDQNLLGDITVIIAPKLLILTEL